MLSKPNVSVAMPVQSISHKLLTSRIEWYAQEVDVYLKEFGKSFRATISPPSLVVDFLPFTIFTALFFFHPFHRPR